MAARNLPAAVRRGLTFWRRSIQARIVVSTVVLTAIVVSVVGWFLLQQTRDGLVDNRVKVVRSDAARETAEAKDRLAAVVGTDDDTSRQLEQLIGPIILRGQSRGFSVVLAGPVGDRPSNLDAGGDPLVARAQAQLGARPAGQPLRRLAVVGLDVHRPSAANRAPASRTWPASRSARGSSCPRTAASTRSTSSTRCSRSSDTIALVSRALLTAGILLLLLVAGVTWLVTRQVVTPVRLARRVAERLAAGQLEERMRVRGDDDIARLATSFNQMASSLQRQIRQLEELSRVQRRFTSDVSHELRTPLTTVRMAGDVLHDARAGFDPTTARASELLQTELDRFEGLLTDLLEISRFDAGAAALDLDDVNLVDVAYRVVDMTRGLAEARGTQVTVRALSEPCLAEADSRRVERIVRNLVSNAIDHAESGGIVILVNGDDHAAAIAVRDYGVGLEPGEAALVFNRFWRADPARARTSGGTGLGLSISLEDTHLHGGWLQAWGLPGRGAQFRLTLPRRAGAVLRQSPLPLVPEDAEERTNA